MGDISDVLPLLDEAGVLEVGESPWRTLTDAQAIFPVDWDRLVEYGGEIDGRFRDLDGEFAEDIGRRDEPSKTVSGKVPPKEWDTCAWYQPIHFFGDRWGIYILEDCVFTTAHRFARFADPMEVARDQAAKPFSIAHMLLRAAFLAFYYHEHYHHRIECLGLRLHVTTGQPRYTDYSHRVYRQNLNTDQLLEEALANANSYLKLRGHSKLPPSIRKATRNYLKQDFPRNPPGYRMAVRYLTNAKFDVGENLLQGQVKEATLAPNQPGWHWNAGPYLTRSFFELRSDIWVVVPKGTTPRLPAGALPKTCSDSDLNRLFKRAGWVEDRSGGKGSHVKLSKPGHTPMIVPKNRDLRPGLLNDALKRLGFSLHDLPSLLSGRIHLAP